MRRHLEDGVRLLWLYAKPHFIFLVRAARPVRLAAIVLAISCAAQYGLAQDVPLISGGAGFFTNTNGGNTSYEPIIEPLIAVPIGKHVLIESRALLVENYFPTGNGYDHAHFAGFTYAQADLFLWPHLTVVAGNYLLPFNTYNDRLTPIWIGNFQDGPLIASLGTMGTGSGLGGMLSGSAISSKKYSINYNAWFSARSGNEQFNTKRSAGARASLFLPDSGVEMGLSYDRLLQGTHENFYGAYLWWTRRKQVSACVRSLRAAIMRRATGLKLITERRPSAGSIAGSGALSRSSGCSRPSGGTPSRATGCRL